MKKCSKCHIEKPAECFPKNKNRCSECKRFYHREYNKVYRRQQSQKEYFIEYYERKETRASRLFRAARDRSEKKNEIFGLSIDWVKQKLDSGFCEKTGVAFDLKRHPEFIYNPFAPSIDKIDPSKPYTPENSQMVIDWYNRAKGQHSESDFVDLCRLVVSRFNLDSL